ncbi:MAG: histidine phosphatase family protein [Deltaproteobacteria bacterium]|nr:histidine phosphatase family protein [Deltaproteobacteria bacterium]
MRAAIGYLILVPLVLGHAVGCEAPTTPRIRETVLTPDDTVPPPDTEPLPPLGPYADAVMYVVRHAEKSTEPPADPSLTVEGAARAEDLADVLADVPLVAAHSTDTARTIETATPTAEGHGLDVEIYTLPTTLIEDIRTRGGDHLVVGHSTTIGSIVTLAGGDPGPPVAYSEFDRLYIVVVPAEGEPATVRLHYGEPTVVE